MVQILSNFSSYNVETSSAYSYSWWYISCLSLRGNRKSHSISISMILSFVLSYHEVNVQLWWRTFWNLCLVVSSPNYSTIPKAERIKVPFQFPHSINRSSFSWGRHAMHLIQFLVRPPFHNLGIYTDDLK